MSGGKKGGNQQQKGNQEQFKFDFGAPVLVNSTGQQQGQQQGGAIKFDFSGAQGGLMQAVSGKLGNLIGQSSGYFESLPKPVQDRIKALRKLHEKRSDLEKDFKKELVELEKKYAALYNPLYDRRKDIVTGASEPTPEELQPTKAEAEKGEQKTEQTTEQKTEQKTDQKQEDVKGVPSFWLEALKHSDEFGDFITDRDEDALQHLYDIKATPYEKEGVSSQSFSLEFFFTPNAFFENDVIKKTYFLVDKEFGTTMFDKVESTEIKWKQGKNLTVKLVTKQQGGNKRGGRGGKGRGGRGGAQQPVKTVTVEEPCQSFFNFFNPTAGMEDADPEELQAILEDDYELGLMVKDEIIPNAVLWFTGEAAELYGPMYGEDFDDDEDDYDDEDEEEEEEEEEEAPRGRGGAHPRGGRGGRGARIDH